MKHEFTFYGDFRADLVVGDSINNTYCFVEFEDATEDSIFISKGRSTSDWSPRFEHGFSQIIDWFWKIDDFKNTSLSRSIFGSENIEIYGILVIGRDAFISDIDKARLEWRLNKVVVDSHKVICITFDQLARDTRDRLLLYQSIKPTQSQDKQDISTDESDRTSL
ncbi:Shedu immune nuclease family protein [Anabaena azotica]|uniref:Shedu immune nuclease family protein n=1 Tax=Anabaena azotica TaxID=197653 RepID=UPI0028C4A963|nr:Shedu immune nuclease family protein [Anabaena azotica]